MSGVVARQAWLGAVASRAGAWCVVLAWVVLTLAGGCATTPIEPEAGAELPRMDELRPAPDSGLLRRPAARMAEPTHRLLVKKIMFDRQEARVDLALESLEPAELPEGVLARWRASGFDVRRIPLERLEMVLANLPRPRHAATIVHRSGEHYAPLSLVADLPSTHRVRVAEGDGQRSVRRLYRGEHRFMVRLGEGDIRKPRGRPALDLLPHHYGPRETLLPRPPHEKMLDGVSFDGLRINEPIPERTVWAIWCPLHIEDAEEAVSGSPDEPNAGEEAAEASGERVSAMADGGEGGAADMQVPPGMGSAGSHGAGEGTPGRELLRSTSRGAEDGEQPPLLGRAMLTGRQGGRAVRLVLLMTVRPVSGATPASLETEEPDPESESESGGAPGDAESGS